MARTPFSLVDEINQVSRRSISSRTQPARTGLLFRCSGLHVNIQGMDQRAERNVHGQLVNVTCGESAGQYFLITPKLLTGLKYHSRMKVLIVNNGKWCE